MRYLKKPAITRDNLPEDNQTYGKHRIKTICGSLSEVLMQQELVD